MRGLPLNIRIWTVRILSASGAVLLLLVAMSLRFDDSPHGEDFEISCSVCHSPKGWELDPEVYSFDHNSTKLPLQGQHTSIDCKLCHPSLVFSDAGTDCVSCHTDMHAQTVGFECARCHTPDSWIVNNITEIHQLGRFPLLGPHLMAECMDCHPSASLLQFEPLRTECFDCHQEDYAAAINPNHVLGNISTNCDECHSMNAFTWAESEFEHYFFPLTDGHALFDCNSCHTGNDYSGLSSECYSCHQSEFNASSNPNHLTAGISTECMECHTTLPGWKPAEFAEHDALFPLTEGHATGDCNSCHSGDYANTSPECISCHQTDFDGTTNPNHIAAGISTECMECHTTMPGWKPADFPAHDDVFPLTEGHAIGDCNSCHSGDYLNTSSECYSCHQEDYNNSLNPKHVSAGLSTECLECHTTRPGWKPAAFPVHDAQFFPINSGKHLGEWNSCVDCHTNSSNWAVFSCLNCHEHTREKMDDKHLGEVPGYSYNSMACLDCHPRGTTEED